MTCCEDDIQFLGFICYYEMDDMPFEHGDWVNAGNEISPRNNLTP